MGRVTKGIIGSTAGLVVLGGAFVAGHELWPSSDTKKVETTFDVDAGVKMINEAANNCASIVIDAAGAHFDFKSINDPSTPEDEDNPVYEQAKQEGQSYVNAEYQSCMSKVAEKAINGDLSDLQVAIDEANNPPVFTPELIEVTPTTEG